MEYADEDEVVGAAESERVCSCDRGCWDGGGREAARLDSERLTEGWLRSEGARDSEGCAVGAVVVVLLSPVLPSIRLGSLSSRISDRGLTKLARPAGGGGAGWPGGRWVSVNMGVAVFCGLG